MRPTWAASRRVGEEGDCATARRRSWSLPSRSVAAAPGGSGRVRLRVVEDLSAASLVGFIEQSVAPGSLVHTDGWGGYRPLRNKGYDHQRKTQGRGKNATR